jgi:hypothetical protein
MQLLRHCFASDVEGSLRWAEGLDVLDNGQVSHPLYTQDLFLYFM